MGQCRIAQGIHGRMAVHLELQDAARDVDRARHVACGVFGRLTHVDHRSAAGMEGDQLRGVDLADAGFGVGHELLDGLTHGGTP